MNANTKTNHILTLRLADAQDREAIYRLRHDVYAEELHQHAANDGHTLRDALDAVNLYIAAFAGDELVGFISLTPPGSRTFSVEKYIPRAELPFERGPGLFEARLLTVRLSYRRTIVATALMYAALRQVEASGGTRIIGIGRREVLPVYRKVGFETLGREIQSGAVTFDLMSATTEQLRIRLTPSWLARARREIDWQLLCSFYPPAPCFHGGAFFEAIGDEFDTLWKHRDVINADVLDAWFPPAPRVLCALQENLSWLVRTSPPAGCEGMLRTIARVRGIDERSLVAGGGSSDLIFLALRHWFTSASRVLLLDPTYGEYAHVLEKVIGCQVTRFRVHREENYDVNLTRLAEALKSNFDLVVLVNPNSPTGRQCDTVTLCEVLRAAPHTTRIWIDEAYVDYVGAGQSLECFAALSRNVVVCKSLSKVYALSGVRAAYLCGPQHLMAELRQITPPWAVSLPAQVAAVNALQETAYYRRRWDETHIAREKLMLELMDLGFTVTPGVANFLLCHLPEGSLSVAELVRRCREKNLFLRDVTNMGVNERAVRIAVKDEETNRRIIAVIAEVLQLESIAE